MRSDSPKPAQPRLTSLSHGGGAGYKIAPGVLSEILSNSSAFPLPPQLLVTCAAHAVADMLAVFRVKALRASQRQAASTHRRFRVCTCASADPPVALA